MSIRDRLVGALRMLAGCPPRVLVGADSILTSLKVERGAVCELGAPVTFRLPDGWEGGDA